MSDRAYLRFLKWAVPVVMGLGLTGCNSDPEAITLTVKDKLIVEADLRAIQAQATPQNTPALKTYLRGANVDVFGSDNTYPATDDLKGLSEMIDQNIDQRLAVQGGTAGQQPAHDIRVKIDEIFPAFNLKLPPKPAQ